MRVELGFVSARRVTAASDEGSVGPSSLHESSGATARTHDLALVAAGRKHGASQKRVVGSVTFHKRSLPARWAHLH